MKKNFFVCIITLILLMTGCGNPGNVISGEDNAEKVTLELASFGDSPELQKQVELFNKEHTYCQIEIKQYNRFEQEEGDGIERMQREIISGNGPDIINFGSGYSITDILGKYTEDLFPYLETFSADSGNDYFSNILQAFSYQDGLYAMPVSFTLKTFAGRSSVIGNRESWTIEELVNCYQTEYEKSGSTMMLYPGETKRDVFGTFLTGSINHYVDWETNTCFFDGDDFKKIMAFANRFPESLRITEDFSPMQCFADGKALLYPMTLSSVYDICKAELVLGEGVSFIGYPVEGTDGTVIQSSDLMLAISIGSEHKEAAWEFISQFLVEEFQVDAKSGFPVNRNALEKQLEQGKLLEYTEDTAGNETPLVKAEIIFEGEEPLVIYQITEEQSNILLRIIEKASIGSAYDSRLHTILLEEADSFFSGDKTLDEATEIIQGRAQMYVGEY